MKNLSLIYGILFIRLFFCFNNQASLNEAKENSNEVTATTFIDENGDTQTCVTCSNGYKFCCTSPKSPSVNRVTKTGSCN